MKKIYISLLSLIALSSCSEKKSDKNLHITGNIKGLKKGTLYIQHIKDTTLVALDTIKIDGDSHFSSDINIDSPEMFYLFLDRGVSNSVDNNLPFFVEPGTINIESSLDFFTADSKITGSKNQELYDEYKKVVSRYVDQNLDLVQKRFDALKANNNAEIAKIQTEQDNILKRKYLYTTNFAVNHADYDIAPYVAVAEIYDINLKYLDTIQKSMTPKIAKSLYGKKLNALIAERKKVETTK
ncbi:DUF4369 domain-containing protein [Flavobacterium sp. SUN052]|uniref:DUF4369 domain-containing protein n=1 Tax=Flavobacterium sp. SUN052 TaxID=3002441 RepID=UPI00237E91AB|nr:DUF4369 domain-containing protein [Flavobacterium sp. SUN052]MEC4005282.1 DUF4369 domain-containing protein [Flavobacterium sp. SUN052]